MQIGRRLLALVGIACLIASEGGCNLPSTEHWSCVRGGQDNSSFPLHCGSSDANATFASDTFSINPLFEDLRHAAGDTASLTYLDVAVHNFSHANRKLDRVWTASSDGRQTIATSVLAEQYMDDVVGRHGGYPHSTPAESALSEGWQAREPGSE